MPVLRLSDTAVERIKPSEGGRLEISDAVITGLCLRVTSTGIKSWSLHYRFAGTQKRLSLGRYPTISLLEARELARDALRDATMGKDPHEQKNLSEAIPLPEDAASTVQQLSEKFVERYAKPRNRTWKEAERIFRSHIYPDLGNRPAKEVRRREVIALLDRLASSRRPHAANHALSTLRKMYNWAIERDEVEFNPCSNIKKPIPTPGRERILMKAEIKHFWAAAETFGYPYGPLFKLLLLTGQRRGEIARLKWTDLYFDEKLIRLSAKNVKAKRSHDIPLSALAIEILQGLPRFKGPYVFTTTLGDKPVQGFGKMKAHFEKGFNAEDWRIHDLRRTCATGMAELGIALHTISRVLNHAEGGVTKIYARYSYLNEKRAALDLWAMRVAEIVSAEQGIADDNKDGRGTF